MDITGCPQPGCDLPAEVLDRAVLASTDGPIEHVRLLCLEGHRFFMPNPMAPDEMPTSTCDVPARRPARAD